MIRMIIDGIKSLTSFIWNTIKSAVHVATEFVKETVVNAPAVTIMTFSAFGIANTMTQLGVQSIFLPISFINEVAIVSVLSVSVVLILSTIAGSIAERRIA